MRKMTALLLGLGTLGAAAPVFLSFWDAAQASGNPDDLYTGLFLGAMCVFVGILILTTGLRRSGAPDRDASSPLWAVGLSQPKDPQDHREI